MASNVTMPSLGFDMTSGKLARWLKKEGDRIQKGEALAEIETEKATVEIEAYASGVLQKILVPGGETVPVGTTIGLIADPGETVEAPPATATGAGAVSQSAAPAAPAAATLTSASAPPDGAPEDGRIRISPLARKMARAAGLDASRIKGSGPGGRIMERDIQAALAQRQTAPPAPSPAPAVVPPPASIPIAPPASPPVPTPAAAASEMPLSRMRQAIAQRMTQSKQTAPHFYVTIEVNMAEALKLREQLNALVPEAEKVSVNDLLVAAASRTLTKFPTFNASYRGDKLELHGNVNVGLAVAVEDGLLTPVLHDADRKSLKQIAAETKGLSERARINKLHPEDLGPGTFTVSNLGMFGVDEFAAILNPPEAAILAVGAVTKRPLVVNDQIIVAPLLRATLSVDHRVADGAQAARFLQELKKLLENPVNLLLA